MSSPSHPLFVAFLLSLRANGRASTATTYASFLAKCEAWLLAAGITPDAVTADDLRRYQRWLCETCRRADGAPLEPSTIGTCIAVVKSAYRWLFRDGRLLIDPAATLVPPRMRRSLTVAKEYLTQQEAQALLMTAGALITETKPGCTTWALHMRNRALIAVALATGRRCHGLVSLALTDVNLDRAELRVAVEKGKQGRVLPIAPWAVDAVRRYVDGPRQHLLGAGVTSPWLFVSQRAERLCGRAFAFVLDGVGAHTIARNPDLTDLPTKRISTHSLRVTFAKGMHDHGCPIRSLNEMMLHASLNTTAAYTPMSVSDLRRALLPCHPRT